DDRSVAPHRQLRRRARTRADAREVASSRTLRALPLNCGAKPPMSRNGSVSEFIPSPQREECSNGEAKEEGREEEGAQEGGPQEEEGWAPEVAALNATSDSASFRKYPGGAVQPDGPFAFHRAAPPRGGVHAARSGGRRGRSSASAAPVTKPPTCA